MYTLLKRSLLFSLSLITILFILFLFLLNHSLLSVLSLLSLSLHSLSGLFVRKAAYIHIYIHTYLSNLPRVCVCMYTSLGIYKNTPPSPKKKDKEEEVGEKVDDDDHTQKRVIINKVRR
ncbi:hypothetical protein DM02DRAFT_239938 [Periconia macrospinosa]|uniref:Uncharacterized protein n=1 Tax=Periconia macrospinosa TaxID=97972 RepID=A0A2V1DZD7_9PLEO|nr:hypothetical protein DM02DRAFT_239938 [Periconia macrospinosa]